MVELKSSGLLVFRRGLLSVEFLLAHPGGPFWVRRDDGCWTVPKGLVENEEDLLAAARREFAEEIGQEVDGEFLELSPLRQKSRKTIFCWMVEADLDLTTFNSNSFELEWPPKSGQRALFPEVDRVAYFSAEIAFRKILPGQAGFLEEALRRLGADVAAG